MGESGALQRAVPAPALSMSLERFFRHQISRPIEKTDRDKHRPSAVLPLLVNSFQRAAKTDKLLAGIGFGPNVENDISWKRTQIQFLPEPPGQWSIIHLHALNCRRI